MTKTKSMIYCGLFTALIAAGAFIKIPVNAADQQGFEKIGHFFATQGKSF